MNEDIMDGFSEVNSTSDIQKCLLYLMKELHDICQENNLIYNIFGGTMLGAVRHQGFIPWDDDIDITMPRSDYEKLKKIVKTKYSDKFDFNCYPQKDYCYPFGKFVLKDSVLIEDMSKRYSKGGLYIDVFPVDGYPSIEDEKSHFSKLRKLKYWRTKCVLNNTSQGVKWLINNVLIMACQIIGMEYFIKKEILITSKYAFEDSETILCQGAGWCEKGKLKKDVYLDRALYKFENCYFWGIKDYDEHLKRLYGNYMQLPPEEERVSNHNYKLYIKCDILKEMMEANK